MKYLNRVIFSCLLASSAAAQSPNPPASAAPANQTNSNDTSKGQDVSGNPQPPTRQTTQTPPSAGQNAATGNDLVSGDNSGQMHNDGGARPNFNRLDINKRGYVMLGDIDDKYWLKSHFAECDRDRDGRVTESEYIGCGK